MTAVADHVPFRLGRVPSLDGARAVAVLLVMGFHAGVPGFLGGRAGVDVFFVLSGFLITALLLQEHAVAGHIRLGAFYMRRVLRLYPALVAAVVVAVVLAAARIRVFDASSAALDSTVTGTPFALLYTMNIARALGTGGGYLGHTWSLAIEEQFYLVWPVVVIALLARFRPAAIGWVALACAVTSTALRTGLDLAGFDSEMLYNATFSHVDGIFAGCALAALWVTGPRTVARAGRPVLVAVASVAAVVVVVDGDRMNVYGYTVVVVATVFLVANLLSRPDSPLGAALSHRALVAIGQRSYGIYLYHWPIFLFIGIDTRPHVLFVGFFGTFAVAWSSYAFIEEPFLRMKRRWSAEQRGSVHATQPS